ncbi:MAG: hypothetical protein J6S54_10545 [Lentisphaeria bacterium]|nr:hypothetical protein [Lentisphaeria bacterium]
MVESKWRLILFSALCVIFLSGCSGFSRLPEINFVGKNREEVVRIFAQNPEKSYDGKINLMIPVSRHNPLDCNGNLYFDTSEEAIVNKQIQKALAIGGYRTARLMAVPGGWDYYEVVFDKNNIAISQKISTQFDGP